MEKRVKVLLADHSEHFGIPCANVMKGHGLDVETMEKDGRKIVSSVEHLQPDVIIMDFFLPRLDAIGVIKAVRALNLPHVPQFMVMSSFDNPNLEREAMLAGADYYFLKPFDVDEMAERTGIVRRLSYGAGQTEQDEGSGYRQHGDARHRDHSSDWSSRPYQRISVSAGCDSDGDR